MPEFTSSHGKIVFTDTATGELPVIFMHGLPTSKELFLPMMPHLSKKFRCITFDLNDYGESEKIGHPISHKQRADVLDELRAHLGLERFILVAHDLGASVAIDYMETYGQFVEKLVLMSPPVYPDFVEPAIVKLVRLPVLGELLVMVMKNALFGRGIRQGMVHPERFTPVLQQAMAGAFSGSTGRAALLRNLRWGRPHIVFAEYPRIIKSISIPTLIIQGRRDPYIPHNQVMRLRQDIFGSELVFIENGGHFLPMDTPQEVAEHLNRWIPAFGGM